jgi:hypothetical protein
LLQGDRKIIPAKVGLTARPLGPAPGRPLLHIAPRSSLSSPTEILIRRRKPSSRCFRRAAAKSPSTSTSRPFHRDASLCPEGQFGALTPFSALC